mmetsp:Transcript_80168/g.194268  ORF Transcript_80168/g.194268 Transcript_80168/m.194268 type:complete len:296 (+) Transcript_80168:56-943(+)
MSDSLEKELAKSSVGLVKAEDYKRKREQLEIKEVLGKARADGLAQAPTEEVKKKKKKKEKPSGLSFDDELDGEADVSPNMGNKKMGKCQNVDVSFLRMNSRDAEASAQEKEQAMREFLMRQSAAKDEVLTANFIYRSEVTQREITNGVHRGTLQLKRGMTTEEVCKLVRLDVAKLGEVFEIPSVAGRSMERDMVLICNASNLPTTVGAFLMPGSTTLFELCTKNWAEGPGMFDDFKHGLIVTERRWYDEKKHTYPYVTWKNFEMKDTYSFKKLISSRDSEKGGVDPTHRAQCKAK